MTEPNKPEHRRTIRSFVLREGRVTPGQRRAFSRLWPQYGIEYEAGLVLDLPARFGNTNPVTVEIGFGNGDSLVAQAERQPDHNFLGVEVHGPGIGRLLLSIEARGLQNLRIVRYDAVELMATALTQHSLHRLQLFFPDPWPKKRHHKRRIVQPDFLHPLSRVLESGGVFHAATDWQPYAEHMLRVLEADPHFINLAGPGRFAPRPADRPETKFERRGERLGPSVWDLIYQRR